MPGMEPTLHLSNREKSPKEMGTSWKEHMAALASSHPPGHPNLYLQVRRQGKMSFKRGK